MANESKESPESTPDDPRTSDPNGDDHGPVRDLADGLDLMLRAARKAMRNVEPHNIEALGRRALDNLDALKRRRVEDLRQEAKRKFDRRRLEEIAEDAGKELLKVVERVADRVDAVVNRGANPDSTPPAQESGAAGAPQEGAPGTDDSDPNKRVRISDD